MPAKPVVVALSLVLTTLGCTRPTDDSAEQAAREVRLRQDALEITGARSYLAAMHTALVTVGPDAVDPEIHEMVQRLSGESYDDWLRTGNTDSLRSDTRIFTVITRTPPVREIELEMVNSRQWLLPGE